MCNKTLVTYGWCRNSWAIQRNLAQHGIHVHAGDSSKMFMAGQSKYCKGSFTYPSFYTKPIEFVNTVNQYLEENEITTYIPIHEEILVVAKYHHLFNKDISIPIDSFDNIFTLYNKKNSENLLASLRFPLLKHFILRQKLMFINLQLILHIQL